MELTYMGCRVVPGRREQRPSAGSWMDVSALPRCSVQAGPVRRGPFRCGVRGARAFRTASASTGRPSAPRCRTTGGRLRWLALARANGDRRTRGPSRGGSRVQAAVHALDGGALIELPFHGQHEPDRLPCCRFGLHILLALRRAGVQPLHLSIRPDRGTGVRSPGKSHRLGNGHPSAGTPFERGPGVRQVSRNGVRGSSGLCRPIPLRIKLLWLPAVVSRFDHVVQPPVTPHAIRLGTNHICLQKQKVSSILNRCCLD